MRLRAAIIFILALMSFSGACPAQNQPRLEAGAQFTVIHLHWVDEYPGGFGGRFGYNLVRKGQFVLTAETEVNYFPQNRFGRFGETELLVGAKGGIRMEKVGFFAKVRPGMVHFAGKQFEAFHLAPSTNFALDVGGVFEYYFSGPLFFRMDMSDTMVNATEPFIRSVPAVGGLTGNTHNFQANFGLGFRF